MQEQPCLSLGTSEDLGLWSMNHGNEQTAHSMCAEFSVQSVHTTKTETEKRTDRETRYSKQTLSTTDAAGLKI